MNEGFPKHYDILPAPVERVIEVAQKLGHFLFSTPPVHDYMSNHYRGAAEMLDQQLYEQFVDRQAEEAAKYDTIKSWVEAGVYTQEQGEELFMDWLNRR